MTDDKKKTNGRRNRSAGHDWEREVVQLLKDRNLYPHAITTRVGSKHLDDEGIDIMNEDETRRGVMDDSISAKNYARALNYAALLDRIQESGRPHPVIFHKQTKRALTGTRFLHRGSYAITDLENYLELMACRRFVRNVRLLCERAVSLDTSKLEDLLEEYGIAADLGSR